MHGVKKSAQSKSNGGLCRIDFDLHRAGRNSRILSRNCAETEADQQEGEEAKGHGEIVSYQLLVSASVRRIIHRYSGEQCRIGPACVGASSETINFQLLPLTTDNWQLKLTTSTGTDSGTSSHGSFEKFQAARFVPTPEVAG